MLQKLQNNPETTALYYQERKSGNFNPSIKQNSPKAPKNKSHCTSTIEEVANETLPHCSVNVINLHKPATLNRSLFFCRSSITRFILAGGVWILHIL